MPNSISLLPLPPAIAARIVCSLLKHWWWDKTLNPFRGCDRVSAGCLHCWCLKLIESRLSRQGDGAYTDHTGPVFVPEVLEALQKDLQTKRYFIPSMSDPFHDAFSDETILAFFEALRRAPWHYYFVLTKRSERLASLGPHIDWPPHVIAVVSVEAEEYMYRIEHLRASGAKRIGVSFEPLIGRIHATTPEERERLRGLDYAIIGGETAALDKVRPMRPEWARELRDGCLATDVPLFFKQWGDTNEQGEYVGRRRAGREIDGQTHDDLPRGCAEHLILADTLATQERGNRRTRSRTQAAPKRTPRTERRPTRAARARTSRSDRATEQ